MITSQKYKMNEKLLNTFVVRSQIERWLNQNKSYNYILKRLYEIHLINIAEEQLIEFIQKEKLD